MAAEGVLVERLAVLGSPIAHSKSPAIQRAAYDVLGIDWEYGRHELQAEQLEGFLDERLRCWRGFSLTMPLKEEAHRLAAILDPVAEESGVVNTLLRLDSDRQRWAGFNTDVAGLAAAISKAGLDVRSTIVLGAGATAVSAILAARRLGAEHVEVVARRASVVGDLVGLFGGTREPGSDSALHVSGTPLEHLGPTLQLMAAHRPTLRPAALQPTLVISTLPGSAGHDLAVPDELMRVPLFDVAYDPWPSPLAERWRASGGEAHSGLGMLVEQALLQVRIFRNGDPGAALEDEDRVLAAMRSALDD